MVGSSFGERQETRLGYRGLSVMIRAGLFCAGFRLRSRRVVEECGGCPVLLWGVHLRRLAFNQIHRVRKTREGLDGQQEHSYRSGPERQRRIDGTSLILGGLDALQQLGSSVQGLPS